jgi:PhnB protein
MLRSTPFLLFDGNCSEAMTFYQECLGGDLTLSRLADTPMKEQFPPEKQDRIINARLLGGTIDSSAADWMAAPELERLVGNNFAVFVTGEADEELASIFDRLAEGAQEEWLQPLHRLPFGTYGQFFDRNGVQWIFRGAAR